MADGKLRLSFMFANAREGFQGISSEFIPVSWGSRVYLIPPKDMIEFCNSVNAGFEPRNDMHGRHLLRCGDEKKLVAGFPSVPAAYEQYLQKRPITSEIIATGAAKLRPSVADWKFKDTPVTIKGGKDIGLRRGMELHVTSPDHALQSVQITEVKERTSEGVVTEIGEESPGPSVGLKLSTLPSWAPASSKQGGSSQECDRPLNPASGRNAATRTEKASGTGGPLVGRQCHSFLEPLSPLANEAATPASPQLISLEPVARMMSCGAIHACDHPRDHRNSVEFGRSGICLARPRKIEGQSPPNRSRYLCGQFCRGGNHGNLYCDFPLKLSFNRPCR